MPCLTVNEAMKKKPDTNSNQDCAKLEIMEDWLVLETAIQRKLI